ncbi:MAG: histone deacetylase family protein [Hyphomonadaceae bacterium]|nr:histone deacetylase family protein [Hyphomonadaceae bacterium]
MLLFTHEAMLRHQTPRGHPEHPGRLQAVLDAIGDMGLSRREAPRASAEAIVRVHPIAYLSALDAAFADAAHDTVQLDADTNVSAGSREACYRAAGACVAAVDAVLKGEDDMAFCAVRPPGHHAEPLTPMGFCIFNNVAIAAMHALDGHGLRRVAVVDFDVHHGNGTQTIAEREPRLLFISAHQSPAYPGTGAASETGLHGNVLNAPLRPGTGSVEWRRTVETVVLPALDAFAPNLLLVSAGFDAHKADPLAQWELETEDFAWIARELRAQALRHCKGKLVSTLEGGYDLPALAGSVRAYLGALMRN